MKKAPQWMLLPCFLLDHLFRKDIKMTKNPATFLIIFYNFGAHMAPTPKTNKFNGQNKNPSTYIGQEV